MVTWSREEAPEDAWGSPCFSFPALIKQVITPASQSRGPIINFTMAGKQLPTHIVPLPLLFPNHVVPVPPPLYSAPSPPLPAPACFPCVPQFLLLPLTSCFLTCPDTCTLALSSSGWQMAFFHSNWQIFMEMEMQKAPPLSSGTWGFAVGKVVKNNYDTMLIRNKIHKCQRGGRNPEVLLQCGKEQLSVLRVDGNKGRHIPTPWRKGWYLTGE